MTETTKRNWGNTAFNVQNGTEPAFTITVGGRDRWGLECLMQAGPDGCTPIKNPGPRWSGYVFNLRRMGLNIETVNEPHSGPFPGSHARYILRSSVVRLENGEAAA